MSVLTVLRAETQGLSLFLDYKGMKLELAPLSEELAILCISERWVAAARLFFPDQYDKIRPHCRKGSDIKALIELGVAVYGVTLEEMKELTSVLHSDKYGRKLEFDFIKMGLNLADFLDDYRRLVLIYSELDDHSSVKKAIIGRPAEWDRKEYMLADLMDALNFQTILLHINLQMQGLKKPIKAPQPVYKRPEDPKPKVFNKTVDLTRMIGAMHRG